MNVLGLLDLVISALGLIASLIVAVEQPGSGADKKAAVVANAQQLLASLPLPAWASALFGNATVLGVLVDLLVGVLNATGRFTHGTTGNPTLTSSGSSTPAAASPAT